LNFFGAVVDLGVMHEQAKGNIVGARSHAVEGSTWQKAYRITPSSQHSDHEAYMLLMMNVAVWGVGHARA
jgi:hypothetical protein